MASALINSIFNPGFVVANNYVTSLVPNIEIRILRGISTLSGVSTPSTLLLTLF